MSSIVTVIEEAVSRRFIEPSYVRMRLGLSQSDMSDTKLEALIDSACTFIESYCDRRNEMFLEKVSETFRLDEASRNLFLSRYPIVSIESITENGSALTAADWEVSYGNDHHPARIARLDGSGNLLRWGYPIVTSASYNAVVVYRAGYAADDDTGGSIPADLREAALRHIDTMRLTTGRDPSVRSEEVPGIARYTYGTSSTTTVSASSSGIDDVENLLQPYRRMSGFA